MQAKATILFLENKRISLIRVLNALEDFLEKCNDKDVEETELLIRNPYLIKTSPIFEQLKPYLKKYEK